MKTCPSCGLEFEDRYVFCTEDGSRLIEAMQATAAEAESAESLDTAQTAPPVLYCPACAMEYPLTFAACPVDEPCEERANGACNPLADPPGGHKSDR